MTDAPEVTVEALVLSLRDGVAALGRPETLRRLGDLSPAQLRTVAMRVQRFRPGIARAWARKDVEVLIAMKGRL